MKERLDKEVVKKNLFSSRAKALFAIKNKNVLVNSKMINKPSFLVSLMIKLR